MELRIVVREPFMPMFRQDWPRFFIAVCHRRSGKTVASVQKLITEAVGCTKSRGRFGYIAPLRNQAKNVAWDLLKDMTAGVPGRTVNESELRVDFSQSGARIQLYGSDNPDALRGTYLDGVVLDEVAQMPPTTWDHVVRPMLTDRKGWAIFIGTPQGKGTFFELWEQALHARQWGRVMLRASDSGLIDDEELAAARESMSPEGYDQEFECSFTAAIRGAFYGKILERIESDGHMVPLVRDPSMGPLTTSWDIGTRDSTSIWIWQRHKGNAWAALDYYEAAGEGVDHYAEWLDESGYKVGHKHLAPHDIANTDWSAAGGENRLAVAAKYGIKFERVERPKNQQEVMEGINAFRMLLPRVYFHTAEDDRGARVYQGRLALSLYRQAYNEKLGAMKAQPVHDWSSHAADAARTFASYSEGRRSAIDDSTRTRINIRSVSGRGRAPKANGRGSTLGYSRGN